MNTLQERILEIADYGLLDNISGINNIAEELLAGLNNGSIRPAEPDGKGGWKVIPGLKQGILLLFKYGTLKDMSINNSFRYFDKNFNTFKKFFRLEDNVR